MDGTFGDAVVGEYGYHRVSEKTGRWSRKPLFRKRNLVLYSWGYLACQGLAGNPAYKVSAAYVEFKNVVNPTDVIAVPTYDRTPASGLTYFQNLPANQDFLRVSLTGTPTIDICPGFEPYFIAGVNGNRITFTAQTTGAVGFLGRTFSDLANSKIFGITLVATPVPSDYTQDVILSRSYFNPADQQLKQRGSQAGIRWQISFQ